MADNGRRMVISSERDGADKNLYESTRDSVEDPWSPPISLDELNGLDNENSAFPSADGLTLYFNSDRPGGTGDDDIYQVTRDSLVLPFGEPELVPGLNVALEDSDPWMSPDGRYIMFTRRSVAGNKQIYEAHR